MENRFKNVSRQFMISFSNSLMALIIIILFVSCSSQKNGERQSSLMVGIAEVNYIPEVGLDQVGNYRGNDYASRGIHDSLYVHTILASNSKGEKTSILSIDICSMTKEPVQMMRSYVACRTDIKPENIMILTTNTYSGPRSDLSAPKANEYLTRAADTVIRLEKNLQPPLIAIGRSKEDRISYNRRLKCIDGTTHLCCEKFQPGFVVEPMGSIYPELITISFTQQGKSIGIIVNFGCHATTLTGNNWLYSADYPGYIVESLKRVMRKNYIPLFFNGCCSNVTQVDYRVGFISTFQEAQRIGYILSISALEAIKNQEVVSIDKIIIPKEMVLLKRMTITDEPLTWAKAALKKVERKGMPPLQADGIPDAEYAQDWIKIYETQNKIDSLVVMVVLIGDAAFVELPGEIFC